MTMNGLSTVNIELTSRCNKECWMCGRRKMEKEYPALCNWGDMEWSTLKIIWKQMPPNIVIQFHNNGEPLLYPRLGEALDLFNNNIRCLNTNGKLLVEKADEIIGKLDTLTISVIQDDKESDEQYRIVKEFLEKKQDRKPYMVYRFLGKITSSLRWGEELKGTICTRNLHSPDGSFDYVRHSPTKPEIGICLDLLHHLAIDRYGNVSPCVRFDPKGQGIIGNVNNPVQIPLKDIWNGDDRKKMIERHIQGRRHLYPLCKVCRYWGVPTGW